MRYLQPFVILSLPAALLLQGCRLPGRDGPVSQSLATCRQLSQRGIGALERGQPAEAESLLADAVRACPADPDARRYYGEALWRRGARQAAVAQLEEAGRLVSEDAAVRVRLAEMYLALGQVQRAWQNAEQAIDLNPKLPAAWTIRGRLLRSAGRPWHALADYHRALGYSRDDRQVLLEVAQLHRELDRPQQALATLQTLADTYSPGEEPQQVLYLQGLACVAMDRYEDGIEKFAAAAVRGQPTPEILCHLGEAELSTGHPQEAAAAARHALALDPEHRPSRELLGRVETVQQPRRPVRR